MALVRIPKVEHPADGGAFDERGKMACRCIAPSVALPFHGD